MARKKELEQNPLALQYGCKLDRATSDPTMFQDSSGSSSNDDGRLASPNARARLALGVMGLGVFLKLTLPVMKYSATIEIWAQIR